MHFINPNLHVILIHYPLALLAVGLLIEIFAFLWPRSTFRIAGRWMILLGALSTVPAVTTGLYAKANVMTRMSGLQGGDAIWQDVRAQSHLTGEQWNWINQHLLFNSCASAIAVLACVIWLSGSDRWRRNMHFPVLLLLIGSMGLMIYGAYGGGEMVYSTRFATMSESESNSNREIVKTAMNAPDPTDRFSARTEYYASPLQLHLIGAGLVIASAAAALGLSLRKSAHVRLALVATQNQADALMSQPDTAMNDPMVGEVAVGRVITTDPQILPVVTNSGPAASRFWLLTAVLALFTIAGGWFTFAYNLQQTHPLWDVRGVFLEQIWRPYRENPALQSRVFAHLVVGAVILILPLLLMSVSRWRAHSRAAISFLALLLIAAVAVQITVGSLMMYDQDRGPLNKLNPSSVETPKNLSVNQK